MGILPIDLKGLGLQALIDTALKSLEQMLRPNMSLDEVAEKLSPRVDNIITKHINEGNKYAAGKFKIFAEENEKFAVNFELYFKDTDGKWLKVTSNSQALDAKEWLSPEAINELQEAREKVYDITAPE